MGVTGGEIPISIDKRDVDCITLNKVQGQSLICSIEPMSAHDYRERFDLSARTERRSAGIQREYVWWKDEGKCEQRQTDQQQPLWNLHAHNSSPITLPI